MDRQEAVQKLATTGRLSIAHAEDLYDSFFEKPVVPQYVADWYEVNKDDFEVNLFQCVYAASDNYTVDSGNKFWHWLMSKDTDVLATLVNMHQFGYEVEKETKYKVRIKGVTEINSYLNRDGDKEFLFADERESGGYKTRFTCKELEEAGFGWVFDCEGIEIEEVE